MNKKNILNLILIVSLIFLCFFSQKRHNKKKVKNIIIKISKHNNSFSIKKKETLKKIIDNNKNIKIKNIDIKSIKKILKKHPCIKESKVFITNNGYLKIIIIQKKFILRIKDNLKNYYLTKNGEKVPINNECPTNVILAEGNFSKNDIKSLMKLISYINKDKFLKKFIVGIKKVNKNSFNLITKSNDHVIYFGKIKNINNKFKKLKAVYKQYLNIIKNKKYKAINLKYKNQVIGIKR